MSTTALRQARRDISLSPLRRRIESGTSLIRSPHTKLPPVLRRNSCLRGALQVLMPSGRIIIRDGVMTEPEDKVLVLRFASPQGVADLRQYAADFKGRQIRYRIISDTEAALPINDAMEFLYTWTWGPEAYPHEVQEQFGYLTPSGWRKLVEEDLGDEAKLIHLSHYLQPGYARYLAPRVTVLNEDGSPARLPDSTCLVVIKKRRGN